ncbi:MAG TPA: FAD binding domain-containing protein [Terriglobales bacterium]|nr:FAD binding domain-containing protein [Terriglobales bacterium]
MSFFFAASRLTAKSQIAIDEPASFRLLQPKSLEEAARMLQEEGAVALAGGCDILEKIKTQWIQPRAVVNLKTVLPKEVSAEKIGAGATVTQVEKNLLLPNALRQAAGRVATPQIRNVGTLGGNLLQDSRCPYYRGPWHCYRAGGLTCDAVRGFTHEHALWGGERCFTVTPSDTAVALVALNAEAEIFTPGENGVRRVLLHSIFAKPSYDITMMHKLKRDELLTQVFLPPSRPGTRSAFRKAAMRQSWDFALASVAVQCEMEGETVREVRIALGAVAPVPWRARAAEDVLRGGRIKDRMEDAVLASVHGAEPLPHNHYKIGLVKNLVRECLEEIMGPQGKA